jgi:YD repeat-containing protein
VVEVLEFDDFGNATKVEDEEDRETRNVFDDAGRLVRVVMADPDGAGPLWRPVIEYVHCKCGRIVEMIETSIEDWDDAVPVYHEDIVRTRYSYEDGDLIRVTQDFEGSNESFTDYEYDLAHNLNSTSDPLGRVTTYEYDLLDRPLRVTAPDPDGAGVENPLAAPVVFMAYDAVGRTLGERDPLGNLTRYQYDTRHRLTSVFEPLAARTEYVFDAASQLVGVRDAEGRLTQYGFDDAGRMTAIWLPNPNPQSPAPSPITFTYDTASNVRFVTDQLGRTTERQYDDLHRVTKEILPHPTGSDSPGVETGRPVTTFTYYADSQIESVTEKIDGSNSRTTSYAFDGVGRLKTVELPSYLVYPNTITPEWNYSYDTLGNVAKVTDPNGNRTEYEYDNLHRVIKVIGEHPEDNEATGETGRPVTEFAYDVASQLLSVTEKLSDSTSRTTISAA